MYNVILRRDIIRHHNIGQSPTGQLRMAEGTHTCIPSSHITTEVIQQTITHTHTHTKYSVEWVVGAVNFIVACVYHVAVSAVDLFQNIPQRFQFKTLM